MSDFTSALRIVRALHRGTRGLVPFYENGKELRDLTCAPHGLGVAVKDAVEKHDDVWVGINGMDQRRQVKWLNDLFVVLNIDMGYPELFQTLLKLEQRQKVHQPYAYVMIPGTAFLLWRASSDGAPTYATKKNLASYKAAMEKLRAILEHLGAQPPVIEQAVPLNGTLF